MSKKLKLYLDKSSSPCRAVWMTCKVFGIEPEYVWMDQLKREHLKPEFTEINPAQSLPTLTVMSGEKNDEKPPAFHLWESRSIMIYLAETAAATTTETGKDTESLYPGDNPEDRARINRALYFDILPLYHNLSQWIYPQLLDGQEGNQYLLESVQIALQYLEDQLKRTDYMATDYLTLADIAVLATVTFLEITKADNPLGDYPRLASWVNRVKTELQPHYDECSVGLQVWKTALRSKTLYTIL